MQIFNDSGFIQIDADYLNMELKSRGSGTIAPSNMASGGPTNSYIQVTVTGEAPVLAVLSAGFVASWLMSRSGNTFTFNIFNGENANTAVEWFVFDNSSNEGPGNSGIQIFNAQSRLVFDSNKKYLRVLDYWERNNSNLETRSYPGKRLATVMCDYGYRYIVANSPVDPGSTTKCMLQSFLDCTKNVGDSLQVQSQGTYTNTYADRTPGMQSISEYPSRMLVVDVTNY
jgi:hypothetical protein